MSKQLQLFNKRFQDKKYISFVLPTLRLEIKSRPLPLLEKAGKDELPTNITNMVLQAMKSGGDSAKIQIEDFGKDDLRETLIRATGLLKELAAQPLTDEEAEGRVDADGYALPDLPPLQVKDFQPETPFPDEMLVEGFSELDKMAWFGFLVQQALQTETDTGQTVTSEELGRFPESTDTASVSKRQANRSNV
jgi:hypothetical protein